MSELTPDAAPATHLEVRSAPRPLAHASLACDDRASGLQSTDRVRITCRLPLSKRLRTARQGEPGNRDIVLYEPHSAEKLTTFQHGCARELIEVIGVDKRQSNRVMTIVLCEPTELRGDEFPNFHGPHELPFHVPNLLENRSKRAD